MGKYLRIGKRAFGPFVPRDLTKLTPQQYQDVVKFYASLPLKELRRRQDINKHYMKIAYEQKNDELLANQRVIEQQLFEAIDLREFGGKGE